MKTATIIVGILSLACSADAQFRPLFRSKQELLATPIKHLKVRAGTDIFWALCRTIERPCGHEGIKVNDPDTSAPSEGLDLKDTNVERVLELLVKQAPAYRWEIRDGVINLEPNRPKIESQLSRPLGPIEFKNTAANRAAFNALYQAGIKASWQGPVRERHKLFDLSFKGGTVRDALNAIALWDHQIMWYFTADAAGHSSYSLPNWGPSAKVSKADVDAERQRFKDDYDRWNKRAL